MNINWKMAVMWILLVMAAAACGRPAEQAVPNTPRPTLTPTPLSTPLPIVPTAVPAGLAENPLRMIFRPAENPAGDEETRLETLLRDQAGVNVDVIVMESYADAFEALCQSAGNTVSAAWLDGISFAAARAQNCGTPDLLVQREDGDTLRSGAGGQMIANRALGSTDFGIARGRVYCRLGYADFYSWLLPTLILKSKRISPADLREIRDYDDMEALLTAVGNGECAASGLSETEWNRLLAENEALTSNIRPLDLTPPFPYAVLVYPLEVELSVRLAVTNGLIDIAENPATADVLRPFLAQDGLARVEEGQFAELDAYLAGLGVNFAQLGE